ncbi:MAG: phytanoyl-CoA dioxygenase family protein [Chloroflexota bacterium]|nr:phytanoyl-CoA dioxygenase family protein [Chloroflexota bacterium]
MHLPPAEATEKRDQLVDEGYTVIPNVVAEPMLDELRAWTEDYFANHDVDPKYRYQGSDIQVIPPGRWDERPREQSDRVFPDPIAERFLAYPALRAACEAIQLEDLTSSGGIIVLSKPPKGPPLYWHQDFMNWESPEAATPWPTKVFLSVYLTDTTLANGCLQVIPGTHTRRIELHDSLPDAHGADIQAVDDHEDHAAFAEHPDAVDLPVSAGDLVIADARVMHAARANTTDARRTLVLAWHDVFPFPNAPTWWTRPIPRAVRDADLTETYESRRRPTAFIR